MYALDIAFDPFRGRAWWVRPFPGALPPATLSIPFGDSKNIHTPRVQHQSSAGPCIQRRSVVGY
jgi:hypothetical protein